MGHQRYLNYILLKGSIYTNNSLFCQNDKRRQEETSGHKRTAGKEMRRMSIAKASALLHLPKDFRKEFNGTIGYS